VCDTLDIRLRELFSSQENGKEETPQGGKEAQEREATPLTQKTARR